MLRDRQKEKGQALVEFALTFFLFIFLVFGVIELGRFVFSIIAIRTAAREGARYGSAAGGLASGVDNYYEDCDGIVAAATRIGNYAGLQDWDVQISYDDGEVAPAIFDTCVPNDPTNPTDDDHPDSEDINLGDRVVVTTSGTIVPLANFLPLPEFNYSSTARRTIVKDVIIDD